MRGISSLAITLASQEGLCSMELCKSRHAKTLRCNISLYLLLRYHKKQTVRPWWESGDGPPWHIKRRLP
jgi:hypothetical protein